MSARGVLHHVELNVSDLGRSAEFWGWLLARFGYVEHQRWDAGVSYRLGDTYLVFVRTEERHRAAGYHRGRVGLNHLAFHAGSRDEVDALTAELRARGVEILYPERHPRAGGAYAVFFEDPDRIKVEVRAP